MARFVALLKAIFAEFRGNMRILGEKSAKVQLLPSKAATLWNSHNCKNPGKSVQSHRSETP